MPNEDVNSLPTKPWWQSKTLWAGVATFIISGCNQLGLQVDPFSVNSAQLPARRRFCGRVCIYHVWPLESETCTNPDQERTLIMSIWTTVEDFFTNLWNNDIKPEAKTAEQVAEAFFGAAIKDAASQLGTAGLQLVTDAVTAAEQAGGTGPEKLAAAGAKVLADLGADAASVPLHVINAAIDAAVAQMNAAKAAAAQPAEPSDAGTTDPSAG